MDEKERERQVFVELLELINRSKVVNNIFKSCAVVWLFTWFIAYGAVVLTNSDFMQLGAVLNNPTASDRENFIVSMIMNVGLNFHVMSGLPSAIYFISRTYKVKKVLNSFREEELAFKSIEQQQNGGIVSEQAADGVGGTYQAWKEEWQYEIEKCCPICIICLSK